MKKIDLKKELKQFYNPSKKAPEKVHVPAMNFLAIEGMNAEPDSPGFQNAIQALFATSFKAKFISKEKLHKDYVVMPLEGLWWADNMEDFKTGNKKSWKWQLMIMQPGFMTEEIIEDAKQIQFKAKKIESITKCSLISFEEGSSMQLMHIGPFSEEGPNIERIHQSVWDQGGKFDGQVQKHHEIYLSDFRKTAPEKLKTVLRQPFTLS